MGRLHLYGLLKYLKSRHPFISKENDDIFIMSYNIRCLSKDDTKERNWFYRAPYIKEVLKNSNPDIIGFQEATLLQLKYLKIILQDYDCIFAKRDKKLNSETNPIFVKKNAFKILQSDTFFLSDTYEKMSNTFNNSCFRICTYVKALNLKTNKQIVIFNTHLDHKNQQARFKSVKLIKKHIKELGLFHWPHVIMGDMNAHYHSEEINELFFDYIDASSSNLAITYNGYGNLEKQEKIDYIALSKDIKQKDYFMIENNNPYPSDHYPIMAVITLENN